MLTLTIFLCCMFVTCAVAGMAALSDLRGLTIPNVYSLIIAGSYGVSFLVLYLGAGEHVLPALGSSVLAALIFFGITFAMFSMKILGAADSKLGTVCVLWVGLKGMFPFLFFMSVAGGALALISIALRKWRPVSNPPQGSWIQVVQDGHSKVPYGVAIFIGMLASFANLGYFKYETFVSLLSG